MTQNSKIANSSSRLMIYDLPFFNNHFESSWSICLKHVKTAKFAAPAIVAVTIDTFSETFKYMVNLTNRLHAKMYLYIYIYNIQDNKSYVESSFVFSQRNDRSRIVQFARNWATLDKITRNKFCRSNCLNTDTPPDRFPLPKLVSFYQRIDYFSGIVKKQRITKIIVLYQQRKKSVSDYIDQCNLSVSTQIW